MQEDRYITATKHWIREVVVGHNFCPFAGAVFVNDTIRYVVDSGDRIDQSLLEELAFLDANDQIETSLIIYPAGLDDWDDYLDWSEMANDLAHDAGYEGTFQLATFHPRYCFDGIEKDDAANYTNRSPYPMLHILRESSVDRAVQGNINVDLIPERNVEHARKLGVDAMRLLLNQSLKR